MSKVISMTGYLPSGAAKVNGVRDRRYTIRYPFAADAEIIDMESGKQISGVTSDISLGGCFICTSQMFRVNSRARLRLSRKGQILEALVVVRIVKPRIGLGVEFLDLEQPSADLLGEWISTLRARR
jgi:PilZ domain